MDNSTEFIKINYSHLSVEDRNSYCKFNAKYHRKVDWLCKCEYGAVAFAGCMETFSRTEALTSLLAAHKKPIGFSSPSCDEVEEKVAEADHLTELLLPPPLSGRWVSEKCEVREGPEYVLRSFMFSANDTFIFSTHRYADDSCSRPGISTVQRGRFSIRGKSWTTAGASQIDYTLDRVELVVHNQMVADEWLIKLNYTCPGALSRIRKMRVHSEYLLFYNNNVTGIPVDMQDLSPNQEAAFLDAGCLRSLEMGLPDTGLVKIQKRPPGPPDPRAPRVELFLGETRQKGTVFYTPILKVTQSVDCEVCLALERASPKVPPSLPFSARLPALMSGEWVSTRCETRPMGLFLRRRLKVTGRSWDAEFRFFSDSKCSTATLVAAAQGHYSAAKTPANRIPGASDFDFMVDKGFLTLHDKALVTSLQKDKKCGSPGTWQLGVKRDLTPSKGCPPLGIVIPTTEYELVRVEVDSQGNTLLYLGHSESTKKGEPKKRPTAFQPPLLQCNAPELPPLTHFLNSYNRAPPPGGSAVAAIAIVIVLLARH